MSDPISDIIREAFSITGDDMYLDDDLSKQIRQQIGRELLEKRMQLDDFVHCDYIREVCQLEDTA